MVSVLFLQLQPLKKSAHTAETVSINHMRELLVISAHNYRESF